MQMPPEWFFERIIAIFLGPSFTNKDEGGRIKIIHIHSPKSNPTSYPKRRAAASTMAPQRGSAIFKKII